MKRISALVLFTMQLAITPALAQTNSAQINATPARLPTTQPATRPINQARPQTAQVQRDQYMIIGQPKFDNRNDWRDRDPVF